MGAFNASAPPLKFPEALLHGMKPRQPLSALPHTGRVPGLGVLWVRRAILQGITARHSLEKCKPGALGPVREGSTCSRRGGDQLWPPRSGAAGLPLEVQLLSGCGIRCLWKSP